MGNVELPELLVATAADWRRWLDANHESSPGVRLVLHKKGGSVTSVTYALALDEALCFGWIDSQIDKRDAQSYLQRFTPRRSRSPWSARNVARIQRLADAGAMMPAGNAAVLAAQADGRWQRAYAGQADTEVPADLTAAIAASPAATSMFATLSATNRFTLSFRVNQAVRPDTRARRIATFVTMLERGETPHPQGSSTPKGSP